MSFLDVNLNDAEELEHLPDNTEALLRIRFAEIVPQKKNTARSNLALAFDVPEQPMVDDIRVWIPIPDAGLKAADPKNYTKSVNRFKEFCTAFRVEMPLEVSDLLGKEGWAIVSEETGLNDLPQNSVRRFVARR